jgi:transcription initiation factor TFIID subunit 1
MLANKNLFNKMTSKKIKKITNYNHSEVADTFQYNIFRMSKDKIKHLHRFDLAQVVYGEILANKNSKWRVRIQNNNDLNNPLRKQLNRKSKIIVNINSQEIHHSHELFKKFSKLSLKGDDFFLFEYVEKNPLILGNIGMASRLTKYYYPTKIVKKIFEEHGADLDEKEQTSLFKHFIKDKFGEHGEENPLDETEQIPLLGQLINNKYEGVAILENNLYRVPVFKQKARKNDFILVRVVEKGEVKYYLRRIKTVYTAGQIQPKSEVFCPYSRQFRFFLKKLLKFSINKFFEEKRSVHLKELKEFFPTMNDHNLRKNIKMLGGEQDTGDNKFYIFNHQLLQENKINDYADEIEASIVPEELCLYERMYQTYYDLLDFGIQKLKSSDKISVIKTKFYRNNLDFPEKCAIARRVIQELMLTSWNLSQSFISAIQTQGRMYLTGYGDPTNGHGGMNFIKLPLKISRYESQLFRKAKKGKTNQMVTGTDADLRRLPMVFVHDTLKKHGFTEDTLANLERWDKIELLRDISNKASGDGKVEDLDKFKREIRMTTKMQKEKYQNDINELLMTMVKNLTIQDWSEIESDDEAETHENIAELIRAEEKEINKYRNLRSDDEGDEEASSSMGSGEPDEEEESDDDDQSKGTQDIDATKILF